MSQISIIKKSDTQEVWMILLLRNGGGEIGWGFGGIKLNLL